MMLFYVSNEVHAPNVGQVRRLKRYYSNYSENLLEWFKSLKRPSEAADESSQLTTTEAEETNRHSRRNIGHAIICDTITYNYIDFVQSFCDCKVKKKKEEKKKKKVQEQLCPLQTQALFPTLLHVSYIFGYDKNFTNN